MHFLKLTFILLSLFTLILGQIIPASFKRQELNKEEIVVGFVLDGTSSIKAQEWQLMKNTMATIIQRLPENAKIFVEVFATFTKTVFPITTLLKENRSSIIETVKDIQQPQPNQPNFVSRAIFWLYYLFDNPKDSFLGNTVAKIPHILNELGDDRVPKVIIIFSDGQLDDNPSTYNEFLKAHPSTTVMTLGFGNINRENLLMLSSIGCAFYRDEISSLIGRINVLLPSEFYEKVMIEADFQKSNPFSFEHPNPSLQFILRLKNGNSKESIPPRTKIEISEISRDPEKPFFVGRSEIIESEIKPNEELEIFINLNSRFKYFSNIPQFLKIAVSDPKARKMNYAIELQASNLCNLFISSKDLFTYDLFSIIRKYPTTLQVLLIGPVGSGKTTLLTTLSSILANERKLVDIGALICDGSQHCTMEKKSYNMSVYHEKKDLKINFIDTIGIEGNSYQNGFLTALINGQISDLEKSTNVPRYKAEEPVVHLVLFVISQRIYALAKKEKDEFRNKIQLLVKEVKDSSRIPMFVITHWDELQNLNSTTKDQMKNDLQSFLNSGQLNTFTIGKLASIDGHLSFNTQIQALQILLSIAKEGSAYLRTADT